MIDKEQFKFWIGVLSDRFNRAMAIPTQQIMYIQLSKSLTTEQFITGAQRAFAECKFWPTPQELVAFALPTQSPEIEGADVFRDILTWNGKENLMAEARKRLDDVGIRAFLSIGGPARFRSMLVTDEVWARKEFIAAYVAAKGDALETARVNLALGGVEQMYRIAGRNDSRSNTGLKPVSQKLLTGVVEGMTEGSR